MLSYIDPAALSYQEWIDIGMAIKAEGLGCEVWDEWSAQDERHKPDDCTKRWNGFAGSGTTGATITHFAKLNGWQPRPKESPRTARILGMDEEVGCDDYVITIDPTLPYTPDPGEQALTYIRTAFRPGEQINIVTGTMYNDAHQKWIPGNKGFTYPYEYICEALKSGLDGLIGDRNKQAGVWIRANPVDGSGVKNENVTAFRHVLIESDDMDLEKQIEIYKRLELPISCLTLSAGKSVHALVKVEAESYEEYKERVKRIFQACEDQGLTIDRQNRNPSRLTRLAGCERGDKQQSLLAVEIGHKSYQDWADNFVIDELPEYVSLADLSADPPELPPETIKGILRKGEKLVLTGPSKAGKSFALIQLAVSLATGTWWMGRFKCAAQRVVYINFELTKANATIRLLDVWTALRREDKTGMKNLSVWNLRGNVITAKGMVDSIIKRHKSMPNPPDYYIVDPIYKINAGDENAAKDVNELLREFDRLCSTTDANLVYAHHHAKGSQFGKRALDRGSGSGVIGRDADAAIDLDFLFVPESIKRKKADYYHDQSWMKATGLRVEMTLRNFESKPPFNVWFKYPIHSWDSDEAFQALRGEAEKDNFAKAKDGQHKKKESTDERIRNAIEDLIKENGTARIGEVEIRAAPPGKNKLSKTRINEFLKENNGYSKDENGYIYPEKVSVTTSGED